MLRHFKDPEQRREVRPLIDTFIRVFNGLKGDVFLHGKEGAAAQRHLGVGGELDYETSMAATIFPSAHDAGQCAAQLVSVLIGAHNRLMRFDFVVSVFTSICDISSKFQVVEYVDHRAMISAYVICGIVYDRVAF